MAENAVFEFVCERLEALSSFERLEARGTIRLALKQAGLDAKRVTREQMAVMTRKLLSAELVKRGIEEAERICVTMISELEAFCDDGPTLQAPEDFVSRTRPRRSA